MTRVEVADVALREAGDALLASALDVPAAGLRSASYGLDIRGWAVGRRGPARSVSVSFAGGELRAVSVEGDRPDVAERFPEPAWASSSGFFVPIGVLQLEPEFEVTVTAAIEEAAHAPIATIRGRRAVLRTSFEPRIEPIGLTGLGRTGSTAVTRLLAAHPRIAAYRPLEYEPRVVTYWVDLLADLSDPVAARRQVTPNGPLADRWWAGSRKNPPRRIKDDAVQALIGGEHVDVLAEVCQGRIDAFYGRVAELLGRPDAGYFVEKLGPATGMLMRELYPRAREIFLVRDFRDMVASIFAFNEKRGFEGFGRHHSTSDVDYVTDRVADSAEELVRAWRARRDGAYLLRYEDLISRPPETIAAVLEFLGLESNAGIVGAMAETLRAPESDVHRTTTAEQSIGRWQRDLAGDVQEACNVALAGALREFGYE
jgi:Sulfotransferase family